MIWPATHGRSWRSACEIALDGARLRAHCGEQQWDLDLAAADARQEFHHWGLCRGTVLRLATTGVALVIGGEGYLSPDLDYMAPLATGPHLILPSSHFKELAAKLLPRPPRAANARNFWLWENGARPLATFRPLLYIFALLMAAGLSVKLAPASLGIEIALACVLGLVTLEVRRVRRTAQPTMSLTVDGERVSLADAGSGVSLGQWPIESLTVRLVRWRAPPSGRAGSAAILDMPAMVVEAALARPLSIGAMTLWPGTHGTRTRAPRYLVSPPCWPSLATALLAKPPLPATAAPT